LHFDLIICNKTFDDTTCIAHFIDELIFFNWVYSLINLVWSSSWIRTLFFNPTQSDEQNSKSSSRIRTSELAQSSSSDRIACSVQFVEQNLMINSRIDLSTRAFCMSRNSNWAFDEQLCLFDSIRRTKVRARVIRPNKNLNSFDSLEREEYVQSCPNLELNTRARVQPNPTTTLDKSQEEDIAVNLQRFNQSM
jgi:hypothetical protein